MEDWVSGSPRKVHFLLQRARRLHTPLSQHLCGSCISSLSLCLRSGELPAIVAQGPGRNGMHLSGAIHLRMRRAGTRYELTVMWAFRCFGISWEIISMPLEWDRFSWPSSLSYAHSNMFPLVNAVMHCRISYLLEMIIRFTSCLCWFHLH